MLRIFILTIIVILGASPALAQGEASTNPGRALYPILIAAGIAYVTRRRAIGGWLFYYYLVLYLSSALAVLMAIATLPNLHPDGWDTFYWMLAVISYVPWLLSKLAELIWGSRLLIRSQRTARNLGIMRRIFGTQVALLIVSLIIGYAYFPEDENGNLMDIISLIVASVWCAYFYVSKRVRYVLAGGARDWSYEAFRGQLKPASAH